MGKTLVLCTRQREEMKNRGDPSVVCIGHFVKAALCFAEQEQVQDGTGHLCMRPGVLILEYGFLWGVMLNQACFLPSFLPGKLLFILQNPKYITTP